MKPVFLTPRIQWITRPRGGEKGQQAGMNDVIGVSWRLSVILIGLLAIAFALHAGREVLAPVALAVVIGLMFGPVADRLERYGVPPSVSAGLVVLAFLGIISIIMVTLAIPLSGWVERWPLIWARVQTELAGWKEAFSSLQGISEGLKELGGEAATMTVRVDDGSAVQDVAMLAPAFIAQIIIFLASLYFFLATRGDIRTSILSLSLSRRLRWRIAHVFRDIESLISRYLLSITVINVGLGLSVALVLWLLGVPSAPMWGMMAALLNYVIYVGPAIMAVLLLGVGLATGNDLSGYLTPALAFLALNMIEAQFVTPQVLGRSLTLNPFAVFLSLGFWIWIWGPVGGFVAVPAMLGLVALVRHVIPANHRRHVAATNAQAENDIPDMEPDGDLVRSPPKHA